MSKNALITGASGGIGYAVATRLAKDGYNIAAVYCNDEKSAVELKTVLSEYPVKSSVYKLDVSDYKACKKVIGEALAESGGFDVVVNCAGVALRKLMTDTTEEEFDSLCGINFKGVYNICKLTVPYMVHCKSGSIINISSMWGTFGASCEVVYSATKAAVIGFTKALARELAPSGIRVNCIAPGAIDTKMNNDLTGDEKAEFASEIPMGRFGKPDEIAGVVSFLAGKDSEYMTAQVITVDGGLT